MLDMKGDKNIVANTLRKFPKQSISLERSQEASDSVIEFHEKEQEVVPKHEFHPFSTQGDLLLKKSIKNFSNIMSKNF
jgi:hypothetical protein